MLFGDAAVLSNPNVIQPYRQTGAVNARQINVFLLPLSQMSVATFSSLEIHLNIHR